MSASLNGGLDCGLVVKEGFTMYLLQETRNPKPPNHQ